MDTQMDTCSPVHPFVDPDEDGPLLAQLLAASVQGRAATGPRAGQRMLRFGDRVEIDSDEMGAHEKTPGLARSNGFSLHEPLELIPGLPIGLGKLAKSHLRRRLTRRRAA